MASALTTRWNNRSRQREAGEFVARRMKEHHRKEAERLRVNRTSRAPRRSTTGASRPSDRRREPSKLGSRGSGWASWGAVDPVENPEIRRRTGRSTRQEPGGARRRHERLIRRRWSAAQDNLASRDRPANRSTESELLDNPGGKSARCVGHIDARGSEPRTACWTHLNAGEAPRSTTSKSSRRTAPRTGGIVPDVPIPPPRTATASTSTGQDAGIGPRSPELETPGNGWS